MFISKKHYHSVNQKIEDMKAELDTMLLPGLSPGRFLSPGVLLPGCFQRYDESFGLTFDSMMIKRLW